ncbi:MAG: 50S ribosomal protein L31 [Candidatus Moraniibacteriota bacterium]|nr:MAG: 50S ribosomal protein L31 [Candidatus Moranbacteria bacterium]
MKTGIHPTYHEKVQVTCVCGAKFETGSTNTVIHTEICSQCHPFYTGKKKFIDAGGRVDRFKKLAERVEKTKATHTALAEKKAAKAAADKKAADKAEKETRAAEAVRAAKAAKAAEAA